MKKTEQDLISAYAAEVENQTSTSQTTATATVEVIETPEKTSTASQARTARTHGRNDLPTSEITGLHYKDNLGYLEIPLNQLPTQGIFYPEGTKIKIRAARGSEIKHWSTMNDQDLSQLSQIDDILNYIIEKCVSITIPDRRNPAPWKDLKDVDRMYLLIAVREFTFIDGENQLMIPIAEGKELPVTKEMIDFIDIPDEIMRHYSPQDRCFVFKLKTGKEFKIYIPSLGVSQWLKNYAQAKSAMNEQFDLDFMTYAPMLIPDYLTLSQRAYEQMVVESSAWSVAEWSLLAYVRDTLSAVARPALKYVDPENGAEVTAPLNFRGGIKALFTIQDPLSILC